MNKWWTLSIFGVVALAGAILAFAIDDGHLRAKPLGLVLLAAGALLLLGWSVDRWFDRTPPAPSRASSRSSSPPPEQVAAAASPVTLLDSIKAIGGLIAVLFAVGAIVTLFVVTISVKSGFTADSAIAFATSAFGVISAITGAYLGIKITSDNTRDQSAATQRVADATQKVVQAGQQVADSSQQVAKSSEQVAVAAAKVTNGD